MRYFPGAVRSRLAPAAVVGTLTLGVLALPPTSTASADDDLRDRAEQVQGQIAGAARDLDEASDRVGRTTRVLGEARGELRAARRTRAAVADRLGAAQDRSARLVEALATSRDRLDAAGEALVAGQEAVEEQQEAIASSVRSTVTQGDPQLLAVGSLMRATSLEDLSRQAAAEETMLNVSAGIFDDLTDAEAALEQRKTEVRDATRAVADKRRAADVQVDRVATLYDDATDARDRVAALVEDGRSAKRAAVAARRADRAELDRLKAREADIRQQILAATRADTGGYRGDGSGFLDYPANAPVTSAYGYRVHPIYGYYSLHNGTDFGVACGATLAASAAGTVLDTYYDEVYGNRLFLSVGNVNGQNMTLVYNHLSGFAVGEGARVGRGQTVGYAGSTGWSTGCHLHFTVLLDGNPVDPMRYL